MGILYFLIGSSILLALVFLAAFFWAMKNGQNDDLQTPAMRILFDDDRPDVPSVSEDIPSSISSDLKNEITPKPCLKKVL